jgi:hypothetical protein
MGGHKMTDLVLGIAIIILAVSIIMLDRKKMDK